MNTITLSGKQFSLLLSKAEIERRTAEMAAQIAEEYKDKNPIFLCNLTGAMFFACDFLKHIPYPCEMYPVKMSSYINNVSSGVVNVDMWVPFELKDRHVIVLEDIVETGCTWQKFSDILQKQGCLSYKIASLLVKTEKLKVNLRVDYAGFEIGNEYVAGYGLDVDQTARNLCDIYKMVE